MKTKLFLFVGLILLLSMWFSCNSVEPPTGLEISLKPEDVSCTEAWITLSSNIKLPASIVLKQNSQFIKTINLTRSDSLLYIDSLLPNTSYQYQASNSQYRVTSNQLQITTLDTTSHNFSFTSYQFGEHSSSVLYDCVILSPDNIWCVGEIYLNDSLGQPDPHPYGIVHWDGIEWKVKRITAQNPSGGYSYIIPTGIFAVSPTEIWLARGGVYLFNGDSITQAYWLVNYSGYNGGIFNNGESASKLWGTSSQDLYTVGVKGALAHYNGTNWQKIESGTTTNINDVWGYYNQTKNIKSVMLVASNILQTGEYRLIAISDNIAKDTLNWPYNHWLKGIWFKNEYSPAYVCGSGIRVYKRGVWEELNLPNYFTESIRANDINDIFTVGDYGIIMHFNGVSWHIYNDFFPGEYVFTSVAVKNNLVIIVGYDVSGGIGGQAVIIRGER